MRYDPKRSQLGSISKVFVKRTAGGIGAWIKAQFILFFIGLAILMIGLYLLDISWWGLKAFTIAIIDVLPLIGSGIIMIPWAIIRLLSGSGQTALWLIVIYLIMVIARQVLEPIIVGSSIGLKPIWTFLATVIGIVAFGPIGAIIGSLAAILIRVAISIRQDYKNGFFTEIKNPEDAPVIAPKDAGQDEDL